MAYLGYTMRLAPLSQVNLNTSPSRFQEGEPVSRRFGMESNIINCEDELPVFRDSR